MDQKLICEICKTDQNIRKVLVEQEEISLCEECNWDTTDINSCFEITKAFEKILADELKKEVKN